MERETKPEHFIEVGIVVSSSLGFSHYEVITREQLASCSPSADLSLHPGSMNQCCSSTHAGETFPGSS